MAYMRGDHYLWSDGRSMHFWAAEGYDSWDESGWAEGRAPAPNGAEAGAAPSGVRLLQEVADEYVVMRFAELVRDGLIDDAVQRALANHTGNFGCDALRTLGRSIVGAVATVSRSRPE